jgi:hypothetical protein
LSKARKSRKSPPIKDEELDEKIEDIEFIDPDADSDEDEEEEYDPEEVYEEEEEQKPKEPLDLKQFSQKELDAYDLNNRRVFFLKALSLDPYQHVSKLAQMCKIRNDTALECISVLMGLMGETKEDSDYPERLLKYFNKLVPDGYPNKATLTADDVNELAVLFKVYEEKLMNAAKITDPAKIFGEKLDSQSLNNAEAQKKVMMDSSEEIPNINGQPYAAPTVERNSMQDYIKRYGIPDIGLMEMALRSVPNPRPNSITSFLTNFTDLYTDWMYNPLKILEQLKFFFGPTHGEHAFRLWKDYREKHQKELGMSGLPQMGEYQPYGFGNMNGMQMQPYQISPELEAERRADARMDKMMKMIQMKMMEKAMDNQTPMAGNMAGQSFEEIYDQNGKVIKRIILPNGHAGNGQGSQGELALLNAMSSMFKEVLTGKNMEMAEILKKVSAPDTMLQDFAKTMMSNFMTQTNPASQVKEMLELTNMVKSQAGPQSNESKSLEQTKLEIDSKLAMQELDLKKMEMQHNWRLDENQAREQDSNVDKWLNTLQGMGESIIKPVAIKFLEGFGKGQMPGGPMGAMFGGAQQQPQQQNPYGMSEQEYAMRQQQYYEQQMQRNAEPLQPIPPMGQPQQPYHQPQRNFNQPQQPPQQQPQQRPISAASDREIMEQVAQLSPQERQQLEDKMLIDDMNREKIKNALITLKNSRRMAPQQQQRSPEQVREAQDVLFRNPNPDALSEEDFGDLDDEYEEGEDDNGDNDYEVPIARGDAKVPPANIQKPSKKFSDYEQRSTTDIAKSKKLNDQQKAMLSAGQMTDRELEALEDSVEEIDDYSTGGVPMPAGLRNASEDKLVEQNLKKTKKSKKKETVIEKADEKQEQKERDEAEDVLKDAEQVLDSVEEIPADDE